jgi:RecA-family ATPase
MWVDTEQKLADAQLIIQDVHKMSGLTYRFIDNHLMVYSLRKTDCKTMFEELRAGVKAYQPNVVILDGIAEFVSSINDEVEAKKLIHELMVIAEEYHCAIICVLHVNRSGNNDMNGHTGSNLAKKVAVVVECKKSGNTITVRCTDSRHQGTPEWSIRFDEQGNIVDADDFSSPLARNARPSNRPNKKQLADAEKRQERLDFCLNAIHEKGGSIAKKDLSDLLQKEKGMTRSNASNFLTALINKDKVLIESNKIITASPSIAVLS